MKRTMKPWPRWTAGWVAARPATANRTLAGALRDGEYLRYRTTGLVTIGGFQLWTRQAHIAVTSRRLLVIPARGAVSRLWWLVGGGIECVFFLMYRPIERAAGSFPRIDMTPAWVGAFVIGGLAGLVAYFLLPGRAPAVAYEAHRREVAIQRSWRWMRVRHTQSGTCRIVVLSGRRAKAIQTAIRAREDQSPVPLPTPAAVAPPPPPPPPTSLRSAPILSPARPKPSGENASTLAPSVGTFTTSVPKPQPRKRHALLAVASTVAVGVVAAAFLRGGQERDEPQVGTDTMEVESAIAELQVPRVDVYAPLLREMLQGVKVPVYIDIHICARGLVTAGGSDAACSEPLSKADRRALVSRLPAADLHFVRSADGIIDSYEDTFRVEVIHLGSPLQEDNRVLVEASSTCGFTCGHSTTYVLEPHSSGWRVTGYVGPYIVY